MNANQWTIYPSSDDSVFGLIQTGPRQTRYPSVPSLEIPIISSSSVLFTGWFSQLTSEPWSPFKAAKESMGSKSCRNWDIFERSWKPQNISEILLVFFLLLFLGQDGDVQVASPIYSNPSGWCWYLKEVKGPHDPHGGIPYFPEIPESKLWTIVIARYLHSHSSWSIKLSWIEDSSLTA